MRRLATFDSFQQDVKKAIVREALNVIEERLHVKIRKEIRRVVLETIGEE